MGFEVMKEAEEFYFPGNEIGVLVIHGFTGSTQSMRFLGERLAETGFTVFGPRLTGHVRIQRIWKLLAMKIGLTMFKKVLKS